MTYQRPSNDGVRSRPLRCLLTWSSVFAGTHNGVTFAFEAAWPPYD